MHGLNMTRAYTVLAKRGGFDDVVRIGRVKTPTTALVVERDRIIENFVPVDYFDLLAKISFGEEMVEASWNPGDTQEGLDSEGRLTDKSVAFALAKRLTGQEATVKSFERKKKSQKAPLGFSLPELQMEASKRFGFPIDETLKICQELYEEGILTYPRSDCQYLPEGHHGDAEAIIQNIDSFLGLKKGEDERLDLKRKHPVFNSGKVEEHHAIIPTVEPKTRELKSAASAKIFLLVALRYLSWFFPDYTYYADAASFDIQGEEFKATGKEVLDEGWKALYQEEKSRSRRRLKSAEEEKEEGPDDGEEKEGGLPALEKGQIGNAEEVLPVAKKTKPPARFTEASLLKAMNTVHRFVKDERIKKILKETDGIGTAATQAKIIKDLFDSGHLIKKEKKVFSSKTARALIDILPPEITVPDLTALWEKEFQQIQKGELTLEETIEGIRAKVTSLVEDAREKEKITLPESGKKGGSEKRSRRKEKVLQDGRGGRREEDRGAMPLVRRGYGPTEREERGVLGVFQVSCVQGDSSGRKRKAGKTKEPLICDSEGTWMPRLRGERSGPGGEGTFDEPSSFCPGQDREDYGEFHLPIGRKNDSGDCSWAGLAADSEQGAA